MYHGSCLCGGIKVAISGPISQIIHCHCSLCRKSSGTAFATNGFVELVDFNLSDEADFLASFEFSPGKRRYFCRRCASPIYSANEQDSQRIRLRLGILDSAIRERPISHNFVTSKANWEEMDAKLPWYEGHEPGR
ncbi:MULTISPECIES: GFA family protein [Shewanella]|uniref:Aldehyde-activating protein n=1 Tax=Shewanella marisflavi TaxID=260364 RepID=A0AAC9XNC7_9GAMM|nr:GFA family protein [Shewanella marisflavi]ASJ96876.1 aldehyde-activating protein [Shewanella marisflavi]MCL1041040.1 GFA family protein [Shewanella marisflavi]